MTNLTPMFRQYLAAKREYPDVLLLFRLGDFYELFGEDAQVASKVLELVLTKREIGRGNQVPMCGLPHHALERYLGRLLTSGYKAAICDQVEDPRAAKGLLKREVTRLVTPGTVVEETLLHEKENNYLCCAWAHGLVAALACADVSTSEFRATEFQGSRWLTDLTAEIFRLAPAECLAGGEGLNDPQTRVSLEAACPCPVTWADSSPLELEPSQDVLQRHFGTSTLRGFGIAEMPAVIEAAGGLVRYLQRAHPQVLGQLKSLRLYSSSDFMLLDSATRRNLELFSNLRDGSTRHTLLWCLDAVCSPMGARLLRRWLGSPLVKREAIESRLDCVEALYAAPMVRTKVREELGKIHDLERILSRLAANRGSPRDLVGLRASLERLPGMVTALRETSQERLLSLAERIDSVREACELIARAIRDDAPLSAKEGGFVREGYSPELDQVRALSRGGRDWIARLEAEERRRTGIKTLKVGFNQVFGYYIEVSKSNLRLVPPDYIRKQTTANAERFYTPELKEYEAQVLGAEERICAQEYEIFCQVRDAVCAQGERIKRTARALAALDVFAAFAHLAVERGYVHPRITEGDEVTIRQGRHPVVELAMPTGRFVPNDAQLNNRDRQLLIVTGPNMAGKSTYLRQVALIVLMAHLGCFVPAEAAEICLVDRIFTRVGAHDDLTTGQSTFMVEMTETANILHNATPQSLVMIDEIGRGTSTFDGLAIAWAVAECIHDEAAIGAKTLFATHYHQLNQLGDSLPGAKNLRVAVKEEKGTIVFLYRVVEGGTDRSYGIQVAKLAGLPGEVLERAKQVLWSLEKQSTDGATIPLKVKAPPQPVQLTLFEPPPSPVVEALRQIDLNQLTPLEALNELARLKKMAEGKED